MKLLRMWRGEKIRVAQINSLRGNPPLMSLLGYSQIVNEPTNLY